MRCTQQPLAPQFYYDYFAFVSLLVFPPFTAFGAAVGELDSLGGSEHL
jgi:hypothetical protein